MDRKLNILGLITEENYPSSRARILQYLPSLEKLNCNVHPRSFLLHKNSVPTKWMADAGKIARINPWRLLRESQKLIRLPLLYEQYKFDLIWQNRLAITQHAWYEKRFRRPRVFDFDDAIWLQDGEKQVQEAISTSSQVFAGNEYLADYASRYSGNVNIIPSVIDTSVLFPLQKTTDRFIIGWIGSASNLSYLELVKPAIIKFLQENPKAAFMVVSSEPGNVFTYDNNQFIFRKWTANQENELINKFSVGLMPLADTPFTRGKCGYKILQYMACGIPVLASPVGINERILKESNAGLAITGPDEWINGFRTVRNDPDFYRTASVNGPVYIENNYSVNKFAPVIAGHFRRIAG